MSLPAMFDPDVRFRGWLSMWTRCSSVSWPDMSGMEPPAHAMRPQIRENMVIDLSPEQRTTLQEWFRQVYGA